MNAKTIYLDQYTAPDFQVLDCQLRFKLKPKKTKTKAVYRFQRAQGSSGPLVLNGEGLKLKQLKLNGEKVKKYVLKDDLLRIESVPDYFTLEIKTETNPSKNKSLSGLYQSGDMLCTQCEAEGFRRIAFSLDRPDALSTYTVTLVADKTQYPVLLANGNLVAQGESKNKHWAKWHDPHPKPSYLFALVAGKLQARKDSFTTQSGNDIELAVYTRPGDEDKTQHALDSLKRCMQWDEEKYGCEYDLEVYNIVAVNDFNMGAMENKGLNIFNTKYVLAQPSIATDSDYHNIEGVIGHEYFHNWSGNRVTCRDWFQLSLKEGFTVFRDQQFSADMSSHSIQRIQDVDALRNSQFKEDAGPMAHPVRPAEYEEINNFYTATVYNKGAEVVRMYATLLGAETFRKGTDLYFKRHDGQAVTIEDFAACMEEVSRRDLTQFKRWYSQAGTPVVQLTTEYDTARQQLSLHCIQSTPETPKQAIKEAFLIPLKTGLMSADGTPLAFTYAGEQGFDAVLELDQNEQTFVLDNVTSEPIVSVLRDFSAPVHIAFDLSDEQLALLMRSDSDAFNRWQASQTLYQRSFDQLYTSNDSNGGSELQYTLPQALNNAINHCLNSAIENPALMAELLSVPSEQQLVATHSSIEPQQLRQCRTALLKAIAAGFEVQLLALLQHCQKNNTAQWNKQQVAVRQLRDAVAGILSYGETAANTAQSLLDNSLCMTDTICALKVFNHLSAEQSDQALAQFYTAWANEPLVVNKWLTLQACTPNSAAFERVQTLSNHPAFDADNPNNVYALLMAFFHHNTAEFHSENGEAYAFAADWILKLDPVNPQIAARLVSCFNQWTRFPKTLQTLQKQQLERLSASDSLSPDVAEIVSKTLAFDA